MEEEAVYKEVTQLSLIEIEGRNFDEGVSECSSCAAEFFRLTATSGAKRCRQSRGRSERSNGTRGLLRILGKSMGKSLVELGFVVFNIFRKTELCFVAATTGTIYASPK